MDTVSGKAALSFLYLPLILMEVNFLQEFLMQEQNLSFKSTLKCLSIGTPKIINFPFVSNGKFMVFTCPNIQAYYNEALLCLNLGHLKRMNFPFGTNGKYIIFRCPNT